MDNKFSLKNFKLLPKKQQRAIYTIIFSLLGFALVVVLSCVFIFAKGKSPDSSSSESSSSSSSADSMAMGDPITDDRYGETVLKKQDNKDTNYLKDTLFIGDSNTERLMEYGHISIDNFVGKTGLSITGAASEACVYFKNDDKAYTIPQAVAKMKPRRVVITLGTNDASDSVVTADFVKSYESFIKAVSDAYPHAKVIINSIPPVTKATTYKSISMDKINDLNEALADMALEKGFSFLNSSEALRDANGYGKVSYFTKEDGVHFVDGGARIFIDFVRTHPETTEDKRPDTKNIPARRAAPGTASSSSKASSSSEAEDKTITYSVQMDGKTAMGTLKNEGFDKKTSYTHTFKDEKKKFSITAVAADGYVFSKWSDGVKDATRSDAVPKENSKITANFTKLVPFSLTLDKADMSVEEGTAFIINATVTGEGTDAAKVIWKVDGAHISTGKSFTGNYSPAQQTVYSIEASYPDKDTKVTVKVTVTKKVVAPPVKPTTITISGTTEGTIGAEMFFTANVANGNAADTVWGINGLASTGAKFSYVPNAVSIDGTLKLTATNNGVTATVSLIIKEKAAPKKTVTISAPSSAAINIETALSATAYIDGAPNAEETGKLIFYINDAEIARGAGTGHTFTVAGTYTLKVITADGTGVATQTITVS